ncbi:restriction endonuclease [Cellulomonas sp. PSBB021]|uniref:restriction endonuclease n=1 Tax=Cellulomonas sp. PSBB021 TaxID=2003551 RepID=UPI000B8D1CB0|nr:restriction endonuclease [Cellulomonas sp. PSBB021]ASR54191.1 hypothetical protein CBP52_02445 [Cellulomonas sp. PSBB021]
MTWQPGQYVANEVEAEEFAAHTLRAFGHTDAARTPTGPDGGIDVRASRALAQVKFRASQTGRPDLQRLVGAAAHQRHAELFFFSGAGFSTKAVEYADQVGVALFTFDLAGTLTPVNDAATRLAHRTTEERHADPRLPPRPKGADGPSWARLGWYRIVGIFWWVMVLGSLPENAKNGLWRAIPGVLLASAWTFAPRLIRRARARRQPKAPDLNGF